MHNMPALPGKEPKTLWGKKNFAIGMFLGGNNVIKPVDRQLFMPKLRFGEILQE